LISHGLVAADRPAQDRFIKHHPKIDGIVLSQ
jgi:hypothetical protein